MRLQSAAKSLSSTAKIREHLSNEQFHQAISHYLQIRRSGDHQLTNSSSILSSIIKSCSQISFTLGESVHACSFKQGYTSFTSIQNSILDFYFKWGAIDSAFSLFKSMNCKDSVSWNIMIHGQFVKGNLQSGLYFFVQARNWGFQPNVSTLVLAAQSYRNLGYFDLGMEFHGFVVKFGFSVSVSVQNSLMSMYSFCGLEFVCKVFDEMSERDLVSWSTLIAGYVWNKEDFLALNLFKEMMFEPDGVILVSVVKACCNLRDLDMGRCIHGCVISRGLDGDVFVQNSLIDLYSRCKDSGSAIRVFNETGFKNVVSWGSILSGLVHNRMHSEALWLLNRMAKEGVAMNEVILVNLLQICKELCKLIDCKLIHNRIIRYGYESNELVLSPLIDAYAACQGIELAWRLFSRMTSRSIVSWGVMIGGFTQCGMPDEAISIFREMIHSEETLNAVIMLNLIKACEVTAELRRSKCAHGIAIRRGFVAEITVGTAIIDMYSKCGAVEESEKVFNHMREKNAVSWSTMIASYGMNGRARDALDLVLEMKQNGLNPNEITALSLLSACSHGGLVSSGLAFFKEMVEGLSIEPGVEHYACLVDMLSRAGKLENAAELIEIVPESFQDEVSMWGALLNGCSRYVNTEIGQGALSILLELEPFTPSGYLLGSRMHAAGGSWADAAKTRRLVKERGVKVVAGCSVVRIDDLAVKFVAGDSSNPLANGRCSLAVEELHRCMKIEEKHHDAFVPLIEEQRCR